MVFNGCVALKNSLTPGTPAASDAGGDGFTDTKAFNLN